MAILIQRCSVDLIGTWNREMGHGLIDAYNAVLGARRRL